MSKGVEKFALFDCAKNERNELVFRERAGYCTIAGQDGAAASVKDVRNGVFDARLASATAIFGLVDRVTGEKRYVLIERDGQAPFEPHKWQFPAGRMGPGELPFDTARRELAEEVCVILDGEVFPLLPEKMIASSDLVGPVVHFEGPSGGTSIRANSFQEGVTTEFFYEIYAIVPSLASVVVKDNEPYGRVLGLFTLEQVAQKALAGEMTAAAQGIWQRRQEMIAQLISVKDLQTATDQSFCAESTTAPQMRSA